MLTIDEQELSILIEPTSQNAKIYTSIPGSIRKFDKLCSENPTDWKCTNISKAGGEMFGKSYECPKEFITFRTKRPAVKPMTEGQRAAASERMKRVRAEQLNRINSIV